MQLRWEEQKLPNHFVEKDLEKEFEDYICVTYNISDFFLIVTFFTSVFVEYKNVISPFMIYVYIYDICIYFDIRELIFEAQIRRIEIHWYVRKS